MRDYVELTKPRLALMLVLTTCIGFYLGATGDLNWGVMAKTLIGTALSAGGTLALNQYIERERDALMRRTQKRPIPAGRLTPRQALVFGTLVTAAGLAYLALAVNILAGAVTAVITATYLFLYTPLKRRTSLSTVAGAIPGALPPVTGWVAARGDVGIEAAVLFAIMFLWQLPHSLALAWLFREDYARAGFRLLPVVFPDGAITGRQIVNNCLALLAVSLLPTVVGLAGMVYFVVALAGGLVFLGFAIQLAVKRTLASARHLYLVSLVYLVAEFATMALDKAA